MGSALVQKLDEKIHKELSKMVDFSLWMWHQGKMKQNHQTWACFSHQKEGNEIKGVEENTSFLYHSFSS